MNYPLGSYSQFQAWTGRPRPWGPEGRWNASFAGRVIDDLVAGICAFPSEVASRYPQKVEPLPVAVGCVPWFTSTEVAEALIQMGGATLVVINKDSDGHADVLRILEASPNGGLLQRILPGLAEVGPLDEDGDAPVIGPGGDLPGDRVIGPLRRVGWGANRRSDRRPLLHAKMLVLGVWSTHEGEYGGLDEVFTPHRVWVGSANWTRKSSEHLEFGAWCDDPALAKASTSFLSDLVSFSEPMNSPTVAPEPEMVDATWDDDAFHQAMDEHRQARLEDGSDDEDL